MTANFVEQLTRALPCKIWRGHISDGSFSIRIEKIEHEEGIYFVYFRIDGIVYVGISDNGFLTRFKIAKNQEILDKPKYVTIRRKLKRIGDTDETLVGRKKIKLRKRYVHMRDHKDLQPIGEHEEPIKPRNKHDIKRIKRLEQSRAEQLISPNTAQIKIDYPVLPVPCPVVLDEAREPKPMAIERVEYGKFKCPSCGEARQEMGYCKPCIQKTEKTLRKLNRELAK